MLSVQHSSTAYLRCDSWLHYEQQSAHCVRCLQLGYAHNRSIEARYFAVVTNNGLLIQVCTHNDCTLSTLLARHAARCKSKIRLCYLRENTYLLWLTERHSACSIKTDVHSIQAQSQHRRRSAAAHLALNANAKITFHKQAAAFLVPYESCALY
jgi:hypothetical protein